jgi:hypothetical protein
MKVVDTEKGPWISRDHPNSVVARGLLMEALGTADYSFGDGLINQLVSAASHEGKIDVRKLNFMLAVIQGIKPNDQLEAMLAAQMAAVTR